MKKILLLLMSLPLITACAASTVYLANPAESYSPLNPSQVKVLAGYPQEPNYTVIGNIAVDTLGNGDDALKLLKEKAAAIGANAVIHLRLTKLTSFTSRTGLSGLAIRF